MSAPLVRPFEPITLVGSVVRLRPLSHDHLPGLVDAANDGRMWEWWYTSVSHPDDMAAEIDRRLGLLAEGSMLPFTAIRRSDDQVLGMTTFMDIEPACPGSRSATRGTASPRTAPAPTPRASSC